MGLHVLLLAGLACGTKARNDAPPRWTPATDPSKLHPVEIVRPPGSGKLSTSHTEVSGAPAAIGCATCHGEGTVSPLADTEQESDVHGSIFLRHADLRCTSCHAGDEPGRLRGVDGDRFALRESMRLCSQCHGLIRRAYDHGAHGGMRGYWDLQRGPRTRNDCITCHDPHAPTHPQVSPAPGPIDRFSRKPHHPGSAVERRFSPEGYE